MEDIYLGYLEDKHYRKVRKSDKPVVFTGRKGAIWGIVLTLVLAAVIALCFTAPFEPEGAWLRWPLGILFFLVELWFLFISYANLNARVILTKESIFITGPVRDFEEGVFADSKLALKQLFRVNRHVEMKWSEIEKIQRPGSRDMALYFYTKSGQRYCLSTFFFDTRFMPTLKRYMKYETVYNWWL
jgi:hypothetical protein